MGMMKMELLACSHQDIENGNKLFNIINVLAHHFDHYLKKQFVKRVIIQDCFMGKVVGAMGASLGCSVVEFGFKPSKLHVRVILSG